MPKIMVLESMESGQVLATTTTMTVEGEDSGAATVGVVAGTVVNAVQAAPREESLVGAACTAIQVLATTSSDAVVGVCGEPVVLCDVVPAAAAQVARNSAGGEESVLEQVLVVDNNNSRNEMVLEEDDVRPPRGLKPTTKHVGKTSRRAGADPKGKKQPVFGATDIRMRKKKVVKIEEEKTSVTCRSGPIGRKPGTRHISTSLQETQDERMKGWLVVGTCKEEEHSSTVAGQGGLGGPEMGGGETQFCCC